MIFGMSFPRLPLESRRCLNPTNWPPTLLPSRPVRSLEIRHTYNSRLAQELAAWADTQPGGNAIHDALFHAYFVDGQNLTSKDVLLSVVTKIGFSTEEAVVVLDDRKFHEQVDADWALSRQYQITGVPTFVANGRGASGAQPYEALEQLVVAAGARRRT